MKQRHVHSLFQRLLLTLIILVLLISSIFFISLLNSSALQDLKASSFNLFDQRVMYRSDAIQKNLNERCLDTDDVAMIISATHPLYEHRKTLTSPYLNEDILNRLHSLTKTKKINGIYLILDKEVFHSKEYPAFYLQDASPEESFNDKTDITAKYGDAALLKQNDFILDQNWKPSLTMKEDEDTFDFYFKPKKAAEENPQLNMLNCGYWSTSSHMADSPTPLLSYNIPLFNQDHQVYGVLGIDLSVEYLKNYLPYEELNDHSKKAFLLANRESDDAYHIILSNGPAYSAYLKYDTSIVLTDAPYGKRISAPALSDDTLACAHQLKLYSSFSPFQDTLWYLIGVGSEDEIFYSTKQIHQLLLYACITALIIATLVALYGSMLFTKPIRALATRLRQTPVTTNKIELPKTHIKEINELSASIEDLSYHLHGAETRLSYVLHTIDIPIGAIEIYNERKVFCTEKVGTLLGFRDPSKMEYTFKAFMEEIQLFNKKIISSEKQINTEHRTSDIYLIHVTNSAEQTCWLRFLINRVEGNRVIVVSDVTLEIQEKEHLMYERDHDVLTQLLNRRAFRVHCEAILKQADLKTCAMVLWDLDNLKLVNDTYGHDAGDHLICALADVLQKERGPNCIAARMAGDEFLLFYHHFENEEAILKHIRHIHEVVNETEMHFGNDDITRVKVSAGISWMPKDAMDFDTLIKHADFAMYEVKNTQKGNIRTFSEEHYLHNNLIFDGRQELMNILEEQRVSYAFQPIVDAKTGAVLGFEALMRPNSDILKTPSDVMQVAKTQKQLHRVEYMTWTQSLSHFSQQVAIDKQWKLFINSIPSIPMLDEIKQYLEEHYHEYLSKIVIELLESEEIEHSYMLSKQDFCRRWHAQTALDDFGSGYSSDHRLFNAQADYVKIDMEFITNIARDKGRQMLVKSVVSFAHSHDIKVIAEGVETHEDLVYLIQHDIDYLQGYYIAKPAYAIKDIEESKQQEIRAIYKEI